LCPRKGKRVDKKLVDEVAKIAEAQGALRESIEETKVLADQVEKLLKRHMKSLQKSQPLQG